ncbi:MAG: hypothetical protein ABR992_11665 [Solirubrobacteraceae bacterium]|jgi:hypothetical protein
MASEAERQQIEVSAEELEILKAEVAAQPGSELEMIDEGEGFAPLIAVAIIGGGSFVGGTVAYIFDRRNGGQVIDLREGAEKREYRSKDVQYGLVLIYTADGKVTVEVKEPKGFFGQVIKDVLDALTGIVTKPVEAIADAVKQAAGDNANVTSESLDA